MFAPFGGECDFFDYTPRTAGCIFSSLGGCLTAEDEDTGRPFPFTFPQVNVAAGSAFLALPWGKVATGRFLLPSPRGRWPQAVSFYLPTGEGGRRPDEGPLSFPQQSRLAHQRNLRHKSSPQGKAEAFAISNKTQQISSGIIVKLLNTRPYFFINARANRVKSVSHFKI